LYLRCIFNSWLLLGGVSLVILHDAIPLSSFGLLLPTIWWPTLLALVGVSLMFALLLWIHLQALKNESFTLEERRRIAQVLALPRTSSERLLWVGISLNAGIWEEIVFRGFLPWYFQHHLTFFGSLLPFVWAAIFSLILFSLGHLYQGWRGALAVGFGGIILALLYALTGSLLASILWHFLWDVRFSFGALTIEGTTQQPATAAKVRPNRVDGGERRPGSGKWHSRQQHRLRQQKDWKEQPREQKGEEPTQLDASKMVSQSAESAQSDVLKVAPESKEAANTDASTIVPERPVRGRAAREQLLRDMGG
jgi:membrane protease YdiL (CAAX protease family)